MIFFHSNENRRILQLKIEIERTTDLTKWKELNRQLDELEGHDKWKLKELSREYDYKLIKSRLNNLKIVSESEGINNVFITSRFDS